MTTLFHDFETRSRIDLPGRGLSIYARDKSTKPLMLSWALDDGDISLWEPHKGPMPAELRDAVADPHVEKSAWNMAFERAIWEHVVRMPTPGQWRDTMIKARYLSLPGRLEQVGAIVGLKVEDQKLAEGKSLIRLFCMPDKDGFFNDHKTHPIQWSSLGKYCIGDTRSERAIAKKLDAYPVPEHEWALVELDARINARGLPVDVEFCRNALDMVIAAKKKLLFDLQEITGLAKPTGTAAFLAWAQERDYPFNDLRKATVQKALTEEWFLPPILIQALKIRSDVTRTATSKYKTILEVQYEGLFRSGFVFYGAQRTGRWSGSKVQPHNMKKPDKSVSKQLEVVTDIVRDNDYEALDVLADKLKLGSVLPILGSIVRSSFRAKPGRILRVSDLNAIENRGLGWLAGCKQTLKVFRDGLDPYKAFGVHLFGVPYDQITDQQRNDSKPAVLGAGYRLGGGGLAKNKAGDIVKTGLWGYAEAMGIKLTQAQSARAVAVFREVHPAIVRFWYELEEAVKTTVLTKIPTKVGVLRFDLYKGFLRMKLPSGRHLYYLRPKYVEKKFEGKEGPYYKDVLTYEGVNQLTKQWGRITTHGGKIAENATQAIARDVLANGMVLAEQDGFDIVGHVHDEVITEQDEDDDYHTVARLCELLATTVKWGPGLPLKAAGFESPFYKKD